MAACRLSTALRCLRSSSVRSSYFRGLPRLRFAGALEPALFERGLCGSALPLSLSLRSDASLGGTCSKLVPSPVARRSHSGPRQSHPTRSGQSHETHSNLRPRARARAGGTAGTTSARCSPRVDAASPMTSGTPPPPTERPFGRSARVPPPRGCSNVTAPSPGVPTPSFPIPTTPPPPLWLRVGVDTPFAVVSWAASRAVHVQSVHVLYYSMYLVACSCTHAHSGIWSRRKIDEVTEIST